MELAWIGSPIAVTSLFGSLCLSVAFRFLDIPHWERLLRVLANAGGCGLSSRLPSRTLSNLHAMPISSHVSHPGLLRGCFYIYPALGHRIFILKQPAQLLKSRAFSFGIQEKDDQRLDRQPNDEDNVVLPAYTIQSDGIHECVECRSASGEEL